MTYANDLVERFWNYKFQAFLEHDDLFEENRPRGTRPPVFRRPACTRNILVHPDLSAEQQKTLVDAVPPWKRHRWFRSMKSSQALVQSVIGNLMALDVLDAIADVVTDLNERLGDLIGSARPTCTLEYSVAGGALGEGAGRTTEIDVLLSGTRRVAIECKLAETGTGQCSRPGLDPSNPHYCDGTYRVQGGRATRCALTEVGVAYWRHAPALFAWRADTDHLPCPLHSCYQLVRNLLAVNTTESGDRDATAGVTVLLVDERNPAFQPGSPAYITFEKTRNSLLNRRLLHRCTWQQVVAAMRARRSLDGLTSQLENKYGL